MKRLFDIFFCILTIVIFALPCFFISLLLKVTSKGPILYWSERVGRNDLNFKMPKFRTMKIETPAVATHLLEDPNDHYTFIGKFLRKASLDELPQIYSVLMNEMSFVGPRPALFNQYDLIELRRKKGVYELKPGITGWAQINGRDDLSIKDKVGFDVEYLHNQSFRFDLRIIWLTLIRVIKKDGVSH